MLENRVGRVPSPGVGLFEIGAEQQFRPTNVGGAALPRGLG